MKCIDVVDVGDVVAAEAVLDRAPGIPKAASAAANTAMRENLPDMEPLG
ncbi:hypothetical protein [Streptomyces sp. NPDC002394]